MTQLRSPFVVTLFVLSAWLLIAAGCEDSSARARAGAQATINTVASDFQQIAQSQSDPLDEAAIPKLEGLNASLRSLSGAISATPALCAQGATPPDFSVLQGPPPAYSGFIEVEKPDGTGTRLERYHMVLSSPRSRTRSSSTGCGG